MGLRGKTPTKVEKRLKALFFGEAGSGKTTACTQFCRPYLIDTERGAENDGYVQRITDRGGVVFSTNDFDEIIAEVKSLISEKHEFRTLIIDPITTVYDDLIQKCELLVGTEFGKHYAEAKKQWKRLANLINRLDMNVIVTSHQKKLYAEGEAMKVVGNTFDGPKGLDYLFDLVVEVKKVGQVRNALIRKSRIEALPEGDMFPFSYDEIATRYGRDVLEREAVATKLATDEQVAEIRKIMEVRRDGDDLTAKYLKKAAAESWEEMKSDDLQKCIDYLNRGATVHA